VVVGIAVAATACGSTDEGDAASTERGEFSWSSLPILGTTYRAGPTRLHEANVAGYRYREQRIRTCMDGLGVEGYDAADPTEAASVAIDVRPVDLDEARARGLNITASRRQSMDEPPSEDAPAAAPGAAAGPAGSEAYGAALDACSQGGSHASTQPYAALVPKYVDEVLSRAPLPAARTAWRACVADAGYRAGSINDLLALVSPSQQEVEEYLTAMDSDERAAFDRSEFEAERDAAEAVVRCDTEAYGPIVDEWRAMEDDFLERHAAEWKDSPEDVRYFFGSWLEL